MDRSVSDRLAIREVIELYSDAVTRRDWETTGALFAEDAVWSIAPPGILLQMSFPLPVNA